VNTSLRFGFEYDRRYRTIDAVVNLQWIIPLLNFVVLHPSMLFTLYTGRKNMTAPIFWGYVSIQIGLVIHDVGFYSLRVYVVAPFSGFYCEGWICRIGLPNSLLMAFVNTIIVANFPSFLSVLVSMHQALISDKNRWKLSRL
ncbi:hypothetical protein PFISCL1PPCAC_3386, partial [Pristionchus fissidentatus]